MACARPAQTGNKEVDDASSDFIQGLVAKSKANKEQYTKDRLNDYYRRNYKVFMQRTAAYECTREVLHVAQSSCALCPAHTIVLLSHRTTFHMRKGWAGARMSEV